MKVFPHSKGQPADSFFRESVITKLDHPNIIKGYYSKEDQKINQEGQTGKGSYLMMEYTEFGDFCELSKDLDFSKQEVLLRTYFHQLISGLEYLHSKDIAHLDIKTPNLLLGADFKLKICDFDFCYQKGDTRFHGKGTENYRAPEVQNGKMENPFAADVYAAGIVLFAMMFGILPYLESEKIQGYDLQSLLRRNPEEFWNAHVELRTGGGINCSQDFKELFQGMVHPNPSKRLTISKIKRNSWFKGKTFNSTELSTFMSDLYEL
mmetsp:Transcript_7810/g.7056  ORF Transcript_7810/g.7056 Transcript_7810/m.7056 type:complete len:264 (+) Transcript_7810:230-1021(+)|eukprot:CAMPEP_0114579444 /NCGR_PEP_ID=MMETSP0125-20121206/3810_1 /TAXON_ID=485358 ORGANISM="Aristerostoma sp., Strain ATCC 50986" /NCGR_SAMPLE_ID=MMETSP0125 /ASSEMBLY_ACC=CAM_ASM_000245 /LENGTH=263 /DNA_ID=CAMNT_0001770173 /DNA_START=132 /DNA_END=923 /DNA_ORIENTATION=+